MCNGDKNSKSFLIRNPASSGSEYPDSKAHHSIVMLALVDANYKVMYVDVGAQGQASGACIWDKCCLGK